MALLDSTRRWFHDRVTSDENISGTPREKLRDLSAALPQLTPQERTNALTHVKAYMEYYHLGHQRESIPLATQRAFASLMNESNRLTSVDHARAILEQHGGPPTRLTIDQSLQRSVEERSKQMAQSHATPAPQELSWRALHPQQQEQKQEQKQQQSRGQEMGVSV